MHTLPDVDSDVKPSPRPYNTARRRAAAQRTRAAILEAAVHRFVERGYAATTLADIAAMAGGAIETIYAVVGRKPTLSACSSRRPSLALSAPLPLKRARLRN